MFPLSRSEHWAEIIMHQHHFLAMQCYIPGTQSDFLVGTVPVLSSLLIIRQTLKGSQNLPTRVAARSNSVAQSSPSRIQSLPVMARPTYTTLEPILFPKLRIYFADFSS